MINVGDVVCLKKEPEQRMRAIRKEGENITAGYFALGAGLITVEEKEECFEKIGGNWNGFKTGYYMRYLWNWE